MLSGAQPWRRASLHPQDPSHPQSTIADSFSPWRCLFLFCFVLLADPLTTVRYSALILVASSDPLSPLRLSSAASSADAAPMSDAAEAQPTSSLAATAPAAASSSSLCRRVSGLSLAADGSSVAPAAAASAAASSVAASATTDSSSPSLRVPRRRKLKSTALPSFFRPLPRAIVAWGRRRDLASVREDPRSRASQPQQVASRLTILQRCFQQQDAELGLPHIPTDLLSIMAGYSARSEYELREVVSVCAMRIEDDPSTAHEFSTEAEFRAFVARDVVEEPRLRECMQELEAELEDAERAFDQSRPHTIGQVGESQESDASDASAESSLSISTEAADRAEMRDEVSMRFFRSFAQRHPAFRTLMHRCSPPHSLDQPEQSAPYRELITRMLVAADPAIPLHQCVDLWKEWSGGASAVWISYRQDE